MLRSWCKKSQEDIKRVHGFSRQKSQWLFAFVHARDVDIIICSIGLTPGVYHDVLKAVAIHVLSSICNAL